MKWVPFLLYFLFISSSPLHVFVCFSVFLFSLVRKTQLTIFAIARLAQSLIGRDSRFLAACVKAESCCFDCSSTSILLTSYWGSPRFS